MFDSNACFNMCVDLLMKLTEGTGPDGTVAQVGQIIIDWVRTQSPECFMWNLRLSNTFVVTCLSPAAWSERIQKLLQQPARSQGLAGPEEAGQAGAGFPAALSGVALQQEVGSVELPGHPTVTPGEIPTAAARDPQTHAPGSPRRSQPGESCMLAFSAQPRTNLS